MAAVQFALAALMTVDALSGSADSVFPYGFATLYVFLGVTLLFPRRSVFRTWSPFQTAKTRAIVEHMTDAELAKLYRRSTHLGAIVGGMSILPAVCMLLGPDGYDAAFALGVLLVVLFSLWAVSWKADTNRFLSSTEWAKAQGISAHKVGS